MEGEIEVLQPGLFSCIQDGGRFGFLNYGVPVSGPMDAYAARLANLILNNFWDDPVLEITQTGPTLLFHAGANIVITGCQMSPQINGFRIKNNKIYNLESGDTLSFGKRELGSRSYLAIQGGVYLDKVLGSFSWYDELTSHFRLKKGVILYFDKASQTGFSASSTVKINENYLFKREVQVFPGPEFNYLTPELKLELFNTAFSIDAANNRMAVQLKEELLNTLQPIITGPVIPGTVQLTPSGKLIVLMKDCQTTGGYPRVLQLSREGLNILAQKLTGDIIQFVLLPGAV